MALNLLERIDSWAELAPERVAHISGGRRLTYAELTARSDSLSGQLARLAPDDRSPVAVIGHKEPEMLIGFLGAVKSGHPYIPLDISIPASRIDRIVQSSGASVVLTPDRVHELTAGPVARGRAAIGWNDPYYVIFTSGSTGEPKGVVITTEALTSFVEWMTAEQQLQVLAEVFLNQAPFSFDLSVMDLYLSLASGGTLFSITADQIAEPKVLYRALRESGLTTWVSTPSFAELCLAEKSFDGSMLPELRRFLFCGETLPPAVAFQLLDRFPPARVWNTYGPTEATCCTTSLDVTREIIARYTPLPVGYKKPDTRILILDEAGQEAPEGETGEIVIAGPNVSVGYLARPELNARAFLEMADQRAYRTGDRGHMQGGLLFFEGRMDSQIKLHGYRIELGEVESNLLALPGIRDAVALPALKEGRPESLVAFVVVEEGQVASDFELTLRYRGQLAERLPTYMLPKRVYCLERLPMTPNGKVDRKKLAAQLEGTR